MNNRTRQDLTWSELSTDEVVAQLERIARNGGGYAVSGFLDTHQWSSLRDRPGIVLDGGYESAQYRRAATGDVPVSVRYLHIAKDGLPDNVNTARQLRSWLYRAGLPDSAAGDIIVGDYAALVVEPDVEPLELGLQGNVVPAWSLPDVPLERITAASNRADAIVATLFRVGRGEAQKAIRHGFIFRNFTPVGKRSQALLPGDNVVFRTKGRAEIGETELNPRSGRLWISFKRYPC